ncbi:hypothetical protein [Methylicorpusculum sp.]|uniref:hypothetical protein n=2 Tax=Methylicorpusculum sp. TaxID=2713644 RepID=UPI00272FEE01|nr:hypothetical protein [Methylicorpusculum sp.]MDP2180481.1 hypothetical protein [Methylicorpusculum sp.]MDP3527910.1 hypothetical protein [Methylicorpusculum sp.]
MKNNSKLPLPDDFSLVLGGPLYQLFIRARLTTHTLDLVKRRVIIISLFTWFPLLFLSALAGDALGGAVKVPFIYDVDVHVRFLLALPLMLVAEIVVHKRMSLTIQQFIERRIVSPETRPEFDALISSAMRLRNSVAIEVILIALVLTVTHYLWASQIALESATWYASITDGQRHYSLAGYWFGYVSIPVFQFLLARWIFRIFIWARFLWQVSRLDLHLVPTHPDRAAGLGFLGGSAAAFMPLLLSQGCLLAGLIANQIFHEGKTLLDFKPEIVAGVVFFLILVLGPLCVFAPRLAQVKRQGLLEYGALANRYVREFEDKWLRGGAPLDEALVGSGDIQSLNDLAGSFDIVQTMRPFPFSKTVVLQTAITVLAPVLPLTLTMISLEDLLKRLVGVLL